MRRQCVMNGVTMPLNVMPLVEGADPNLKLKAMSNVKWVDNPSSFSQVSWGVPTSIHTGRGAAKTDACKKWIGWHYSVPYQEGRGLLGYPGKMLCASPGANDIIKEKLDIVENWWGLDWVFDTNINSFFVNDCMFPDHAPLITDIGHAFVLGKDINLDDHLEKLDDASKVGREA